MTPEEMKAARTEMALTQGGLALLLGISRRYVQLLETDGADMPRWMPLALKALRIQMDEADTNAMTGS